MSLDPRQRREEREQEKAIDAKPLPLNPPFPFARTSFDPFFFGLEVDAPEKTNTSTATPSL